VLKEIAYMPGDDARKRLAWGLEHVSPTEMEVVPAP
jgi:hypothetical protein